MKKLKICSFNLKGITNLIVSKHQWNKTIRGLVFSFNKITMNSIEVAS